MSSLSTVSEIPWKEFEILNAQLYFIPKSCQTLQSYKGVLHHNLPPVTAPHDSHRSFVAEKTPWFQVRLPIFLSTFTENDIDRNFRTLKDKSDEPWFWATRCNTHCTLSESAALTFFSHGSSFCALFQDYLEIQRYRTKCYLVSSLFLYFI